jgi:hypothetical protein
MLPCCPLLHALSTKWFYRGIVDSKDQEALQAITEKVLGPPELRSPERPKMMEGTYNGGTAFERSSRAYTVKGLRCYTTALSYQDPSGVASVTAGSKRVGGEVDNLNLRREVNLVCCPLTCLTIVH